MHIVCNFYNDTYHVCILTIIWILLNLIRLLSTALMRKSALTEGQPDSRGRMSYVAGILVELHVYVRNPKSEKCIQRNGKALKLKKKVTN